MAVLSIFLLTVLLLVAIGQFPRVGGGQNFQWLQYFEEHIIEGNRYKNVALLINPKKNEFSSTMESIEKVIMDHLPTFVTTIETSKWGNRLNKEQKSKQAHPWRNVIWLNPPSPTTLFVILHSVQKAKSLSTSFSNALQNFIMPLVPNTPYPKILVVTSGRSKLQYSEEWLRQLWMMNVLDVTILELTHTINDSTFGFQNDYNIHAVVHIYNPFSRIYTNDVLTSNSSLMPDKRQNLYKYALKACIIAAALSKLEYSIDSGSLQAPQMFRSLDWICSSMNCIFQRIIYGSTYFRGRNMVDKKFLSNDNVLNSLKTNKFEVLGNTLPLMYIKKLPMEGKITHSQLIHDMQFALIVPVKFTTKTNLSQYLFFNVIAVLAAILVVFGASRFFRFNQQFWEAWNIFYGLLGMESRSPYTSRERIIFAFMLITSMTICSDMITELVELVLKKEIHRQIGNVEDIVEAGLTLRTPYFQPNFLLSDYKPATKILKEKMIRDEQDILCMNDFLNFQNVTCFFPAFYAMGIIDALNVNQEIMSFEVNLMTEDFERDLQAYVFRQRFPLLSSFNNMYRRYVDFGFVSFGEFSSFMKQQGAVFGQSIIFRNALQSQLSTNAEYHIALAILVIAWLVGIILFVIELRIGQSNSKLVSSLIEYTRRKLGMKNHNFSHIHKRNITVRSAQQKVDSTEILD